MKRCQGSRVGARPAFSLAEIMIAIGILGIGLLMVAATFPVGLDQSRIVAEQSIAPLVADEAFERLQLLVDEPPTFQRIPYDASVSPPVWRYSFRESLRAIAVDVASATVCAYLTNGVATDNPDLAGTVPPYKWTGLNELLVAPYVPNRGASARFYPSMATQPGLSTWPYKWSLPLRTDAAGRPQTVEPPYTWSALYRAYTVGTAPDLRYYVQFFVFVNRHGSDWPSDWPKLVNFGSLAQGKEQGPEIWFPPDHSWPSPSASPQHIYYTRQMSNMNNSMLFGMLSEGGFLVRVETAGSTICRIKQIQKAGNLNNSDPSSTNPVDFHRITLDQTNAFGGAPDPAFWFVPADTNTGRSPCIGAYSRTYRLD